MTPLSPDEALYAFMDSELDVSDEQKLFDELASSNELRTEMKDILSIRNAVHRDLSAPSAAVESSLLAMTGLSTATVGVASASTSPWLYGGVGCVIGAAIMASALWFGFMNNNDSRLANNLLDNRTGSSSSTSMTTSAPSQQPPVSTAVTGQGNGSDMTGVVVHDTIIKRVTRTVQPSAEFVKQLVDERVANELVVIKHEYDKKYATALADLESQYSTQTNIDPNSTPATRISSARLFSERDSRSTAQERLVSERFNTQPVISSTSSSLESYVRLRTLASGLDNSVATPTSVRDAILPNTAFAFMIPISDDHAVGVEMATESYIQKFQGTLGRRTVNYTQTPVLFWMGGSYEWIMSNFQIMNNLSPYISATGGFAFSQGPVARASAGLSYRPSPAVSFNAGFDVGSLWFRNEGTWYSASKWGFTYGMSINLGSLR